jgi:hypothetical protein
VVTHCLKLIRERSPNVTISVEVEKPGREGLEEMSLLADYVFYSRSWAMAGVRSPKVQTNMLLERRIYFFGFFPDGEVVVLSWSRKVSRKTGLLHLGRERSWSRGDWNDVSKGNREAKWPGSNRGCGYSRGRRCFHRWNYWHGTGIRVAKRNVV